MPAALAAARSAQAGQGLVEYALILVLIAILAIASLMFIGGDLSNMLHAVGSTV